MRKYAHRAGDGGEFSEPGSLRHLSRVVANRVARSTPPLAISVDGEVTEHDLDRSNAPRRFTRTVRRGKPGHVYRLRAAGEVLLSAHEVVVEPKVDPVRTAMVSWCRWGIEHAASIHYSQARPIHIGTPGSLPLTMDCSGSTILFARWAGAARDPGGYSFSGYGNTRTIIEHGKEIRRGEVQIGDIVTFGTEHTAVVIEVGEDPLMESHGMESGPIAIRLSTEARYHAGQGLRYWSLT